MLSVTESSLLRSIIDLYLAGTETTSTAISWALLFFLHYPHVQDTCYKEISDVVGTDRLPSMRDKPEMTYLEATICEVLRLADIVPMSVWHGLASDVTFRGYVIPKDAVIIPYLDSVLQDKDVWGDPEVFRPERFIGPDGKLTRPDEFIPFSVGKWLSSALFTICTIASIIRHCSCKSVRLESGRPRVKSQPSHTRLYRIGIAQSVVCWARCPA